MIVRKLRNKNNWSQEQLAEFCGLNIRTIQRVESGNKASTETLKCLASVFEVNISTLTEEITVIDKKSEEWRELPWWFKFSMAGIMTRRGALIFEFCMYFAGCANWLRDHDSYVTLIFFLTGYITARAVRYADKKDVWGI